MRIEVEAEVEANYREHARRMDEHHRSVAGIEQRRAEVRGMMIGRFEALRSDPELIELLRQRAWVKADPAAVRELAARCPKTGGLLGLPQGWPEGVPCQKYVDQVVESELERYLADFDAGEVRSNGEVEATESVRRLRDVVQGGTGPRL
jgi:hypothetical protein